MTGWIQRFDTWRDDYWRMSYADHQQFYNEFAAAFPDQKRYHKEMVVSFLASLFGVEDKPIRVWELGGWDGALARDILAIFRPIQSWTNVEICPDILDRQVCDDQRYWCVVPDKWAWDVPELAPPDNAVVVMSHVLEHIPESHAIALLKFLRQASWMYIQMPTDFTEQGHDWDGHLSTHALEWGWMALTRQIQALGFVLTAYTDQARVFARVEGEAA